MTPALTLSLTLACALLHFLVDGLCACCLYVLSGRAVGGAFLSAVITYNVLAFLSQPLTGLLADALRRRHLLLVASVGLLSAAVAMALTAGSVAGDVAPASVLIVAAVLLGVGNSLFHVWGGKQVALATANDARHLGVFVSTGAVGLAVGLVWSSWPLLLALLLSLAVLSAVLLYVDGRVAWPLADAPVAQPSPTAVRPSSRASTSAGRLAWLVVAVLACVVMVRSLVAGAFSLDAGHTPLLVVLLAVVAMAGKALGGFVSRRGGLVPSLVVLFVLSLALLPLRAYGLAVVLAGLFLINCTMPLTLSLACRALPGREGLAFGLLAAALVPGYVLALL